MEITFRRLTVADKPRVLEISAGVWGGEDYIPAVIDAWLAAADADLIAACVADAVVGFARSVWLTPHYVWQQGLRIHADWRNRGIARAITGRQVALAAAGGARRIGLSTYVDNAASQRLIAAHGFMRVAEFVYLTAAAASPVHAEASLSPAVVAVTPDDAARFIRDSVFLANARGFLPDGWMFRPFALSPAAALTGASHCLGLRSAGQLVALLCAGAGEAGPMSVALNFLDGSPDALHELTCHLLAVTGKTVVEAMVPGFAGDVLAALRALGFSAEYDGEADVYVYERELVAGDVS